MKDIDFHKVLDRPFWILRAFGMWFDKSASKVYKIYGVAVHFFVVEIFMACQIMYVFNAKSLIDISTILTVCCTYIMMSMKTIRFMFQVDGIVDLIEELNGLVSHIQAIEMKEMLKLKARVNQAKSMFRFHRGACTAAGIAAPLIPLTAYLNNPNPPFRLPYTSWSPFDHENIFLWFLVFSIYETLDGLVSCQVVAAVDTLPVYFFNAGAGLLEELGDRLSYIRESAKEKRADVEDKNLKLIEKYIEVHLEVKAFIKKTQNTFSHMIFAQVSISLVIICTTAFTLSKVFMWELN